MRFQERRSGTDRRAMPAAAQLLQEACRRQLRRRPEDLCDRAQADRVIAAHEGDILAALFAAFELGLREARL